MKLENKNYKQLKATLDKVFSEYIRARDGRCFTCGSTENLQCGHLFSRVSLVTRWFEKNAHAQCNGCNLRHEYDFAVYEDAFINCYGQEEYDRLKALHYKSIKLSRAELIELIGIYQNKLEELCRDS